MFPAYQRFCCPASIRVQLFKKMDMCGLINDPDYPKAWMNRELEAAEMKKSKEAVHRSITTILNFTNPFTIPDKYQLYSLAFGAPSHSKVEIDVHSRSCR